MLVLYTAVVVFISGKGEDDGARTASNSVAEITPLSRNNAANRSRCSAGEAFAVIARASVSVSIPFACSTRTSGSLWSALCEKTAGALPRLTIKIKVRRRYRRMIKSFLPRKGTKGTKRSKLLLCSLCLFVATALLVVASRFRTLRANRGRSRRETRLDDVSRPNGPSLCHRSSNGTCPVDARCLHRRE